MYVRNISKQIILGEVDLAELIKIGTLAKRYDISTRTIRYYEEVKMINSIRDRESNVRFYDSENIKVLEQILLLRALDFSIEEIKDILINKKNVTDFLHNKFFELTMKIEELSNYREVLNSIIKINNKKGINNINIDDIIKDQVYINSKLGEKIKMNDSIIMIEFGTELIPLADRNQGGTLIDKVKLMKKEVDDSLEMELPSIRIRDNEVLEKRQYRILIKNEKVFMGYLNGELNNDSEAIMVSGLKNAILKNISII